MKNISELNACNDLYIDNQHHNSLDSQWSTRNQRPRLCINRSWKQNMPNYKLFVKEIPIWMQTPPDFDPCDGLCTHKSISLVITQSLEYRKSAFKIISQSISHVPEQVMEYLKTAFKIVHKPFLWKQRCLIDIYLFKTHLSRCKLLLISI